MGVKKLTDITMCDDRECPLKDSCFRFRATPSQWQSFFVNSPNQYGNSECPQYLKADYQTITKMKFDQEG